MPGEINVSFGDDNIRYPKQHVPQVSSSDWEVSAWRGERVHTQILVWTKTKITGLRVTAGDLTDENGNSISSSNLKAGFVRYVMTDEFGEGCDKRTPEKYDSSLVPDPIDIVDRIDVRSNTVQPVWLTVKVPQDIPAGTYRGSVIVKAGKEFKLGISINVSGHTLPPSSDWKFDLDLWQNPDPIAKVHGVKLWSDEHYRLMRPYYEMLAGAGQKSITAFIIDQPWGPDHVYYRDPSLIDWTRKKDGSWSYDYSQFDKYIEFVMSCGINKRINCYSMITWDLRFIYFDEAKDDTVSVYAKPGTQEYLDLWLPMISDFTSHLKAKGWFDKTSIAMDERDMQGMLEVMKLMKSVDPQWKTALAGNYHREIAMDIFDYCIIWGKKFDQDILDARRALGLPTTFYTACGERLPNIHSFSPPAEATWLSWYSAANGLSGYLFWAYNNWTSDVLHDTRYKTWPAGDCYQIYPGPRSSIRFEKLIEGIQDYEKVRILKEQFKKEKNIVKLKEIEKVLSAFTTTSLEKTPAAVMVNNAKAALEGF
ncbi:MAG: DUF4091 domain-containing protein [Bacteroidetes bacterium]|nr:DUF4091 domain-containing protein [Bacteroidota bacterium]